MARAFAFAFLLVLVSTRTGAGAPEPVPPTEQVVRFQVTPMGAPIPALKHRLLPEIRDMNPGNPIQGYSKCFMEQNHFFFSREGIEKREAYLTMPLDKLPLAELRDYGGVALRQADRAARLLTPDWQILLQAREEGIYLLLPEVQQMRTLARALQVRFRVEVAQKRFSDAIRTAQTLFALARHHSEHPTLIAHLVGLSIAAAAVGPLEEMIGQPGCPNLYWALTDLPDPLVSLRKGMQGERLLLQADLAGLDDQEAMTKKQLDQVVEKIRRMLDAARDGPREGIDRWLSDRVEDAAHVRAARRRLIESGMSEKGVEKFPATQVVLLDDRLSYEIELDEARTQMTLPYWQFDVPRARNSARREKGLLVCFAPLTQGVRRGQVRLQQRLALLRVVEALRMHARAKGSLPTRLDEVQVTLPLDPVSGRAFTYQRDGGKVTLRGTPPRGFEKIVPYNFRYEISLRK